MSPARLVFLVILGLGIAMGLIIGTIKMVAPDAANVTFNGAEVTGWPALSWATAWISRASPSTPASRATAGCSTSKRAAVG